MRAVKFNLLTFFNRKVGHRSQHSQVLQCSLPELGLHCAASHLRWQQHRRDPGPWALHQGCPRAVHEGRGVWWEPFPLTLCGQVALTPLVMHLLSFPHRAFLHSPIEGWLITCCQLASQRILSTRHLWLSWLPNALGTAGNRATEEMWPTPLGVTPGGEQTCAHSGKRKIM